MMATPEMNADWTPEELAVFAELGIGEENVSLRKLIRGQREINGRLYHAISLILDTLPQENTQVTDARAENNGVPGPPPGCSRQ